MKIRNANTDDAVAISSLVINTAAVHIRDDFTEEGWELLLRLYSEECQRKLISSSEYRYYLAEDNNDIQAVLTMREESHIFQFFVKTEQQQKGIGKILWFHHLNRLNEDLSRQKAIDKITVKASTFGIPFYLKLGFRVSGQRQLENGIYFTPFFFLL